MRSVGIVRKVDKLGRITLAKEDRIILGIKELDPVEMVRDGKEIKIKKYEKDSCCIFCLKELKKGKQIKIGNKNICLDCASKIGKILEK